MSIQNYFKLVEDYEAFLDRLLPLENENRIVYTNHGSLWKNLSRFKYLILAVFIYKIFRYFQKKPIPFKTLLLKYYYKKD